MTKFSIKQKPYNLLLLATIMFFPSGLVRFNSTVDIHLHDTYFVMPWSYFMWFPAIILFCFWLLYLVSVRILFSKPLTWFHVAAIIITALFYFTLPYTTVYSSLNEVEGSGAGKSQSLLSGFTLYRSLQRLSVIIFSLFLIAQVVYLVNLCMGMYLYFSKRKAGVR